MSYGTFTLVKELPGAIYGKLPLRLYTTPHRDGEVCWHLGFPKQLVEPVEFLLSGETYWAESHWAEDGDWWIYHTFLVSPLDCPRTKDMDCLIRFLLSQYDLCVRRRGAASKKEPYR